MAKEVLQSIDNETIQRTGFQLIMWPPTSKRHSYRVLVTTYWYNLQILLPYSIWSGWYVNQQSLAKGSQRCIHQISDVSVSSTEEAKQSTTVKEAVTKREDTTSIRQKSTPHASSVANEGSSDVKLPPLLSLNLTWTAKGCRQYQESTVTEICICAQRL